MKQYFFLAFLFILTTPKDIYFTKILTCVQEDIFQCSKWNQSTTLSYEVTMPNCFSEDTYVVTHQGPKPMSELKIDDEILAYDTEKGKVYSKVIAWLYRDPQSISTFHKIKTKEGPSFVTAKHHNIAVLDQSGNINFKFSRDLMGEKLVQINHEVEQITEEGVKKGLYSPFTQIGNYYILDMSASEPTKGNNNNYSMILVHVLSQVKNPSSQIKIVQSIIQFLRYFGLATEAKDSAIYSHPLLDYFSLLFGEKYIASTQTVTYHLKRNGQSSSYQLVDQQTSSSSSQQKSQQKNRIFGAGLSYTMIIGLTLL